MKLSSKVLLLATLSAVGCNRQETETTPPTGDGEAHATRSIPADVEPARVGWVHLAPEQYREQVGGLHWPAYEEALEHFGTEEKPGRLYEVFDTIALIKHKNGRIPRMPDATQALRPEILRTLYDSQVVRR